MKIRKEAVRSGPTHTVLMNRIFLYVYSSASSHACSIVGRGN